MKGEGVKLLLVNCSPRSGGNCEQLSDYLVNYFAEDVARRRDNVEAVHLRKLNVGHCLACDECGKRKETGKLFDCIQKDDMHIFAKKMIESDGIIFLTPVYFGLPSDVFSKVITRTRYLRHQNFRLSNRVVAVIAIAARRSGGAETTIISSWLPLIRNGMLIVGNGNRTCQFGAMMWASGKGEIFKDKWGLTQAQDTVERVFEVAKLIKTATNVLSYENPMIFDYKSGTLKEWENENK